MDTFAADDSTALGTPRAAEPRSPGQLLRESNLAVFWHLLAEQVKHLRKSDFPGLKNSPVVGMTSSSRRQESFSPTGRDKMSSERETVVK